MNFYAGLLCMKVEGRKKIAETRGEVVNLKEGEQICPGAELLRKRQPLRHKILSCEGSDHPAVQVENLDDALQRAKQTGFPTKLLFETEKSRWAYIVDPNGIWIELVQ